MRPTDWLAPRAIAGLWALACTAAWAWVNPAAAGPIPAVEGLQQVLRLVTAQPEERDRRTQQYLEQLHGLGDVCQALLLTEWRDQEPDSPLSAVDARNHGLLEQLLDQIVLEESAGTDTTRQALMAQWMGYVGLRAHQTSTYVPLGRKFSPALARLAVGDNLQVRLAALRALPTVFPQPADVEQSLGLLLCQPDRLLRQAAAQTLVPLFRSAAPLAGAGKAPADVHATQQDLLDLARAIVLVAGRGAGDEDAEVRRLSVQAISEIASSFAPIIWMPLAGGGPDSHQDHSAVGQGADLVPLVRALSDQATPLAQALGEADASVRLLACQAFSGIALGQQYLLGGEGPKGTLGFPLRPDRRPPEVVALLGATLQGALPALTRIVADPDARVRLTAIEVLEDMGPAAAAAAPALIEALDDPNSFVRWAASRTLGKIGPSQAADRAVPALARLLSSADREARLAAARSLQSYGPAALPALLALQRALGSPDAELRLAAANALGAMRSLEAAPSLSAALEDPEERVRQCAAAGLGGLPLSERDAEALCAPPPDTSKASQRAELEPLLPRTGFGPTTVPGGRREP